MWGRLALPLFLSLQGSGAVPGSDPEQFHLAVTGSPGEVLVTYVTRGTSSSSCIVHGLGAFSGSSRTYTDGGWEGAIHAVHIKGLNATMTYRYSCGGSAERELRMPPSVGALPLRVAAVADLGEACSKPGCGNATIRTLADLASGGRVDMILHAGDIAYTSGDQNIWDEFGRELDPATSRLPYMVCPGNHEHYYAFSGYRHRFDMPGPYRESLTDSRRNLWSSYDVGGVHFVSISTEHLKPPLADEQVAFLRDDLFAANKRRGQVSWIVAYGHRPLYCSTKDYYDCHIGSVKLRKLFEPLFQEFGVDLYLTGHLHNYERSWPISDGEVEKQGYDQPKGTVHVVIGSAGDDEGLTDKWESVPSWSAVREGKNVGYAEIVFANASTCIFTYRESDTRAVIDSFTLRKDRGFQQVVV